MLKVSYCDSHLSVVCQCVNFFIQTTSVLKPLIGFWPNFTEAIPRCSSTKVVQTIPVGCISRSPSHKIGFQNAIFKDLLVWNYKVQSFHIWYIASSRGPLPNLFKLCPWGQNWPRPGGHNFTLNYITKFFKQLLLNHLWEFVQTKQEWSLGSPLPTLFKWFWLVA